MAIEITEEFQRALDLLDAGKSVFITGNAGTGKSTLIRHFIDNTDRKVVVAAPTGVAALNVGGYTLHRLFSFGTTTTLEDVRNGSSRPQRYSRLLKSLDTLIIDEVSMVRADLFDMVCATLEKYGPQPGEPLGGIQLVLVGDLYQLPPVLVEAERPYFEKLYPTPYFFSAAYYDAETFPSVNLTKVFRQIGDRRLVDMLNAIRNGRVSYQVLDDFNQKTDPQFSPDSEEFWLTLATTNRLVNSRNKRELEKLEGTEYISQAHTYGEVDRFEAPTDRELHFKVGAQVMLLTNESSGKWVNGSIGRITAVDQDPDTGEFTVHVQLRNGKTVEVGEHEWEITQPRIVDGHLQHEVIGRYKQLPFRLAWAITIHKSQGQTLERAIIDLRGGTFATGQLYVALSRCKNFDGIVLTRDIAAKDVKVDPVVRQFLGDLAGTRTNRRCYLGIINVGEGDGYVRPIELCVLFEDGTRFETLINPTRDLGEAATKYDITAADVLAAPLLNQVWPYIETLISGYAVTVIDAEHAIEVLDTELKRHGTIAPLEDIIQLSSSGAPAPRSAYEAAKRAFDYSKNSSEELACNGYVAGENAVPEAQSAFALARETKQLTALGDPELAAAKLSQNLAQTTLPEEVENRIQEFEQQYGVRVERKLAAEQPTLAEVLQPGAFICFTGSVMFNGESWTRERMMGLAEELGFVPVNSVTIKRCDLLVAADPASLSGKAKKARQLDKPIVGAEEFLSYLLL